MNPRKRTLSENPKGLPEEILKWMTSLKQQLWEFLIKNPTEIPIAISGGISDQNAGDIPEHRIKI